MGGLFGGGTLGSNEPRLGAMRIQTSSYGMAIPIVYGQTRITANLLWYGDFKAVAHEQDVGGKGGDISTTTYTYEASGVMGLCEGPITSITKCWSDKKKTDASEFAQFVGTYPQTAWSYLTSNHKDQSLSYQGLAYVAATAYQLDGSASLPNHSFEVIGRLPYSSGSSIYDANPANIITDFLTNTNYGAGFPLAKLDALFSFSTYCRAVDLLLSVALNEQKSAAETISDICRVANSAPVWSEGRLKIIPYGDIAATGNGATYTPDVTPQYDLTDDDFLDNGDDPIKVNRKQQADAHNQVQIEFMSRANDYNIEIVTADDQANIEQYGLRPGEPIAMHSITTVDRAKFAANIVLQRMLYVRNIYQFRLGWRYARLEPMDIVTLTDPALGLDKFPVRILEIEEDEDGGLSLRAEEFPAGIGHAARYTSQTPAGYKASYNTAPGDVEAPVFFEPPISMTTTGLEVWAAVTGSGNNWGGCEVWASYDGSTYKRVGEVKGGARYGALTAMMNAGHAATAGVLLAGNGGQLLSGTAASAAALETLCWIGDETGGEYFAYQTSTLTGTKAYNLTGLVRGAYDTADSSHASGQQFVRVDSSSLVKSDPLDLSMIGSTIYFKFLSFNVYGGAKQGLDEVGAYPYTITGVMAKIPPKNVMNFIATQNGNVAQLSWNGPADIDWKGCEIRRQPQGVTNWNTASFVTNTRRVENISTVNIPPGLWTILIKTFDQFEFNGQPNYSLTTLSDDIEMVNSNDVIDTVQQVPGVVGTLSGFLRHWTGKLVPLDQLSASAYGYDLFDSTVPTPVTTSSYTSPDTDIGIDNTVRAWSSVESALGMGVASANDPVMLMDSRTAAGAYDGFETWNIGDRVGRYFKWQLVQDNSQGARIISAFNTTLDLAEREQKWEDVTIGAGGLTLLFTTPFHRIPHITGQVYNLATEVRINNVTKVGNVYTQFDAYIYNIGSNTSVGGVARKIIATGV